MGRVHLLVATLGVLSHGALLGQEPDAGAERGAEVYQLWCAHCHDAVPQNTALEDRPGVAQLELKYGGALSPYITERPDLAHFEVLEVFLRNGAGSMPPFRKTEITDEDIAALAAYLERTATAREE